MDIFSALADPTRLKIVEMLATKGKLPVSQIKEPFDMSAPAISQHLKALLEANLVVMTKQAQSRIYAINKDRIHEVGDWVTRMQAGLAPTTNLAGERKRRVVKHNYKKPIMAVEDGALSGFLRARAK